MDLTNLFVPAEDSPHSQTFMQWPSSAKVYPDRAFLGDMQQVIANIANTIAAFEPVKRRARSVDFVASYANFYVCNGAVIMAQFGDLEADAAAIAALRRHYPTRKVVALNVDALGEIGGGIHCATQQMPMA